MFKGEFQEGWPVAAGAFIGQFFSVATVVVYSFGLFASILAPEFRWTPLQVQTAFAIFSFTMVIVGPVYGLAVDRFGGRAVVIVSTACLGIVFGLLAFTESLAYFYAVFAAIAVFGAGTSPVAAASVLLNWFDRNRGLALGIMAAGAGAGAMVFPPVIQAIIAATHWREAYAILGVSILAIGLPSVIFLLRSAPPKRAPRGEDVALPWKTRMKDLAGWRITWVLGVFAAITGIFLIGTLASFVPILRSRGVEQADAAAFQALFGLSVLGGRLLIGPLLDRFFAPRVVLVVFLISTCGLLALQMGASPAFYGLAAIAIGLSLGAEVDVMSYLVSRYYPRMDFGMVFGVMFSLYTLGTALGPLFVGAMATRFGGYDGALTVLAALALAVSLLTFLMPAFRTVPSRNALADGAFSPENAH